MARLWARLWACYRKTFGPKNRGRTCTKCTEKTHHDSNSYSSFYDNKAKANKILQLMVKTLKFRAGLRQRHIAVDHVPRRLIDHHQTLCSHESSTEKFFPIIAITT
ncbi:hypothetical protein OAG34_01100 [bacterium]|nr:hypothetical protein [bacterium]